MTRILIADDHPAVRKGLKDILAGAMGKMEFGEAEDAQQAIAESRKPNWDLIVLDLSMPGKSGLDTLKQIKHVNSKLPILVFSMHSESQYALRAIRAGASGYLSKDADIDELLKAVNSVMTGGKYISRSLAERIADHLDGNIPKPPHENLNDREYQILCMLAAGKKLKDISKAMSLSIKTISVCRQHILEKMNARSNNELTQYSIQNRLIG
jgi:two-component system, NarL family, invasion response regulator UvrY